MIDGLDVNSLFTFFSEINTSKRDGVNGGGDGGRAGNSTVPPKIID